MKLSVFFGVILTSFTGAAVAQTAFTDARGDSSVLLDRAGGFAQISFGSSLARLGYQYDVGKRIFFGFDVQATLRGDSGDIFSDGRLAKDAKFTITLGNRLDFEDPVARDQYVLAETTAWAAVKAEINALKKSIPKLESEGVEADARLKIAVAGGKAEEVESARQNYSSILDRIKSSKALLKQKETEEEAAKARLDEKMKAYDSSLPQVYRTVALLLSGRAASYDFYDSSMPFADQFRKRSFEGFGANLVYNHHLPGFLFASSIGFEQTNNVDDLTLTEITRTTTIVEGEVTQTIKSTKKAYVGTYKEFDQAPLRLDIVHWPASFKGQIGVNAFGRVDLKGDKQFVPGIGIFLAKKGAPLHVVGGLNLTFQDGKPKLMLIAGYNF